METKTLFERKNIIITVLIILLLYLGYRIISGNSNHKVEMKKATNLHRALTDSIMHYQNDNKEWVAEKLTIQASEKDLKDENLKLTYNQMELLEKVEKVNEKNQVINAALIKMKVELATIKNTKPVIQNDSTIQFSDTTDSLHYVINVHSVRPTTFGTPSLEIHEFSIPNSQFVNFNWKDSKKEGYPISFTVTNSNPFFKVYDLDSYAIPELEKTKVKPSFWNKLDKFGKSTGGKVLIFGLGVLAGGALIE